MKPSTSGLTGYSPKSFAWLNGINFQKSTRDNCHSWKGNTGNIYSVYSCQHWLRGSIFKMCIDQINCRTCPKNQDNSPKQSLNQPGKISINLIFQNFNVTYNHQSRKILHECWLSCKNLLLQILLSFYAVCLVTLLASTLKTKSKILMRQGKFQAPTLALSPHKSQM